jgi:hypothetical protein
MLKTPYLLMLLAVLGSVMLFLAGCGGGSTIMGTSDASNGHAVFTIKWPEASTRLIPKATKSLLIVINEGSLVVSQQVVTRGTNATQTVEFEGLPIGQLTVTAYAYATDDGTGTTLAFGSAPLTVTEENNSASNPAHFTLTLDPEVVALQVAGPTTAVAIGDTGRVTATPKNAKGETVLVDPSTLTFATSDSTIATVDGEGVLTAKKTGTVTVTVTYTEKSTIKGACAVAVAPVKLTLTPLAQKVNVDGTVQYSATVTGAKNTAVTWSVKEAGGGSISTTGLYTPPLTAAKTYTVVATSVADPNITAATTVTTNPVSVVVSPGSKIVGLSAGIDFTAAVTGLTNTAVTWSVKETAGGTINADTGAYTAPSIDGGPFTITATSKVSDAFKGTASVTVKPQPVVEVTPSTKALGEGETATFTASVTGASNTAVTWSCSAGGSITAAGVFTAAATTTVKTVTVTAKSNADPTQLDTATVTVSPIIVTIDPTSASLKVGGTKTFTASVTGATTDSGVVWSVKETGGGTVTQAGVYTAPASPSTATFHVVATSKANSAKKAEAAITLQSITVAVTPKTIGLSTGEATTFDATVTGAENTGVNWTVVEATGGAIDTTGHYTAPTTTGTYHVKATSKVDATKFDTATITVTVPPIGITPKAPSVDVGGTIQFSASLGVNWSVVSANGGTIDATGKYTAPAKAGTYQVKAVSKTNSTVFETVSVTVTAGGANVHIH